MGTARELAGVGIFDFVDGHRVLGKSMAGASELAAVFLFHCGDDRVAADHVLSQR
jgi:hypothetical protein